MKRIILILLVLLICAGLIACTGEIENEAADKTPEPTIEPTPTIDPTQEIFNTFNSSEKSIEDLNECITSLIVEDYIKADSAAVYEDDKEIYLRIILTYEIEDASKENEFKNYYGLDIYRVLKIAFSDEIVPNIYRVDIKQKTKFYYTDNFGNFVATEEDGNRFGWIFTRELYNQINHEIYEELLTETPWSIFAAGESDRYHEVFAKLGHDSESDIWIVKMRDVDAFYEEFFSRLD